MPKMKYFQAIGELRDRYDGLVDCFTLGDLWATKRLLAHQLTLDDEALINEEINVFKYLIGCQNGFVFDSETSIKKPAIETVNRALNRQLNELNRRYGITTANVEEFKRKAIKDRYLACEHYLKQFQSTEWVASLPDEIQSADQ